jgi:fluoride ion exporter CrcB/FEX
MDPWWNAVLFALATGFGGSLSTVSSMVKEIVSLAEATPIRAHGYAILTFGSAMIISLIIYSATIRIE